MPSKLLYLTFSALAHIPWTRGQDFSGTSRDAEAFSYVQPLNTTILGQYGHSPAVYPSPELTGRGGWEAALVKAKAFLAQLTLEEKANFTTGFPGPCVGNTLPIERLGFPGLCLQDGPLSIRVADYASVFPAGVTVASSWDRDLLYERGFAMGQEFRAKGAQILLGPVCGPLGRSGFAGRNWEGFAADPYLTGVAMEKTIVGIQDAGVQATAKHFIANEQETQRNPSYVNGSINFEAISANLDDRTMHELYLWPFADAVRAGVASIMCSYNRINGSQACQNSKAQNGLLKEELGFQGYVMSDWGGTHSGLASVEGGLDMDMPGGLGAYGMVADGHSYFGQNLTLAVNNGTLNESRLNDMVLRILTPYFWLGQDQGYPSVDPSSADLNTFSPRSTWLREWNLTGEASRDVRADHAAIVRKQAASSIVLLKNEAAALPLRAPKSVAVFGNSAGGDTQGFLNQNDFEYGSLSVGGGSGTGRLTYLVTPLEAVKNRAAKDDALVQYWLNNTLIAKSDVRTLWVPKVPDVCLVFLKSWATEGADRTTLEIDWDGNEVVESVASVCNNTVVITQSAGINVLPFASHENVTAILAAHYGGQEAGNAIVDVLYGDVNPSGKLPYTIAHNSTDYNAPPTTAINTTGIEDWQSWFDEGLEIDYRYFDANNISVLYEFGHGLSYTTFALGANLTIDTVVSNTNITALPEDLPVQPGGNPALWEALFEVTATVSNTGSISGQTVPQLYLTFPSSTPSGTPPKQLRGFDKLSVAPGQTRNVTFALLRRDVSYWDVVSQQWRIPTGDFTVSVGFSSRDLQASATLTALAA